MNWQVPESRDSMFAPAVRRDTRSGRLPVVAAWWIGAIIFFSFLFFLFFFLVWFGLVVGVSSGDLEWNINSGIVE